MVRAATAFTVRPWRRCRLTVKTISATAATPPTAPPIAPPAPAPSSDSPAAALGSEVEAENDAVAAAVARDEGQEGDFRRNGHNEAADLGPGTGWLFNEMNVGSFMYCVSNACKLYRENPKMWRAMQIQAMSQDLSWYPAALKWAQVFVWSKIDPPHCQPQEQNYNSNS